jgi:ribosomal protein S27E
MNKREKELPELLTKTPPKRFTCTAKCRSCGKIQEVDRIEFSRAARVACVDCGGTVDPLKPFRRARRV